MSTNGSALRGELDAEIQSLRHGLQPVNSCQNSFSPLDSTRYQRFRPRAGTRILTGCGFLGRFDSVSRTVSRNCLMRSRG